MSDFDAISAEVRERYESYVAAFMSLARGESADLESFLNYYAVPCTLITGDRYLVLDNRSTVRSFCRDSIDRLRRASYARSHIHHLEVRPLNARSALIEGMFSRYDQEGTEFARFGGVYIAGKTDDGWQFITVSLL